MTEGGDKAVPKHGRSAGRVPRRHPVPVRQDSSPENWKAWGRSPADTLHGIESNLDVVLGSQSRAAIWIEALLLTAVVVMIDIGTGADLNFSIFYLVPVIFATWFLSRGAGLAVAFAGVVSWIALDLADFADLPAFVPLWNGTVRLAMFALVVELVHLMRASKAREAALARTDSLTGVANGRAFSDRAATELATMKRTGGPITLAYVDLDHFKDVNDAVGHTEGDRLLLAVANAIRNRMREADMVARLGGDEFGILLPNTGPEAAVRVLAAAEKAIRHAVDGPWGAGCTIGAVTFVEPPESVDFMVRAADELMYSGKRCGRARVEHALWPEEPTTLEFTAGSGTDEVARRRASV